MADISLDLLIVDDDAELREALVSYMTAQGHRVTSADSGETAVDTLASRTFAVAVVDMVMPGMSGIQLLEKVKDDNPEMEVILLTGQGTIERAVEAMKLGAYDFLTKPVRMKQLETVIAKAGDTANIRKENRQLKALLQRGHSKHKMIGESPAMEEVFRLIERAAPSEKPILIQGESGTGKELVARALHDASCRSDKPLVVINCAALPEPLLESELFGHEKGAFTGAAASKPGLFEVADGGTLFIDEIGELAPALQPKLLRVLEDGSLRRVGSLKERHVDVRMIAATNRDLSAEVEAKRFREDLYYRINMMTIMLPPLRGRTTDDILLLADHFAGEGWEFDRECREAIARYSWPGNVRQLINAIERAKILADDEVLRKENLPPEVVGQANASGATVLAPDVDLASLTRARVVQALQHEGGNKLRAAKSLGVSRRSLYRLIEKYHIERSEVNS
ncbi:sigma-54-dependent transcriptional regulator [Aeoliella mucimassa]|uniref:Transcriptional regulatory protein ZraR n=1 Tax=Aeoliella mucimassa TaxID=2527972 RepID=A0A518AK77_9BACT|nr:sigma-54 dependent transcriptional regulator [Aeoliella mucimassa]QDU55123.1 Transcriptional regulatory protein ZraR [Aeoliella mucimassa]